jgi:hypothetical protein
MRRRICAFGGSGARGRVPGGANLNSPPDLGIVVIMKGMSSAAKVNSHVVLDFGVVRPEFAISS